MKHLKLILVCIVLVCGYVNISCTSPSPEQPKGSYSSATRELIALVDGDSHDGPETVVAPLASTMKNRFFIKIYCINKCFSK